ncbi:peptidoglycan editing factor PgeF [Clostridium sp.]|uniref:peptidoglycan editing factor PgeF n=1 Tax=Clostridium sp. TaxID=1506 RepID=UPI002603BF71|nr:peptidoglycan editing factor PgeF [Clostridium sp.]
MNELTLKDFTENKDYLVYEKENFNIVFSTAENNRSFNRNIEDGIKNINLIKEEFLLDEVIYLKQVHSDVIYKYKKGDKTIIDKEGDGLVSNVKNIAIGVFTADCVPIIIIDNNNNMAAIHSGWKGTYNSIILKAIESMRDEFNADINDIKVFIGPHIRQCCYEISLDLKEQFLEKTGIEENILFNGRKLSLEECILKDIRNINIKEENIYNINLCTHCEENIKLFSYRKSVGTYGRLFSFVFYK